jgi:hypothetical protein
MPKNRALTPYLLSLPERAVRSLAALAGGLLREISDITLPAAVRRTRLYRVMVDLTLRFLVEQVGQVKGTFPDDGALAEDFLKRRTAGNGIEILGIVAFRASPVWVMAILADVSGAGRKLINEIADSLKEEGLLDRAARFDNVDQLLDGLERSASRVADAINTPPLDVAGLRREWAEIREQVKTIPAPSLPKAETIQRQWDALRKEAAEQGLPVFALSALLAVSALRVAGRRTVQLLTEATLGHYTTTLQEIHRTGYLAYWAREFRPYLRAAAENFSPRRRSTTQRLLRKRRAG